LGKVKRWKVASDPNRTWRMKGGGRRAKGARVIQKPIAPKGRGRASEKK